MTAEANMDEMDTLTEIEQLLLMAAATQGLGPGTDRGRANTVRIVDQALRWMGLTPEQVRQGWEQAWEGEEPPSLNEDVYNALVRMTRQRCARGPDRPPERPGEALFEGGGNWGVPGDPSRPASWPHFNSCSLTAHGERLARALLGRYPAYREVG
jgi:hypothetical protein